MVTHAGTGRVLDDGLHILGAQAEFTPHNLIINLLVPFKRAKAGVLDGSIMDKDICATLGGNEAVALAGVEPVDFSKKNHTHFLR